MLTRSSTFIVPRRPQFLDLSQPLWCAQLFSDLVLLEEMLKWNKNGEGYKIILLLFRSSSCTVPPCSIWKFNRSFLLAPHAKQTDSVAEKKWCDHRIKIVYLSIKPAELEIYLDQVNIRLQNMMCKCVLPFLFIHFFICAVRLQDDWWTANGVIVGVGEFWLNSLRIELLQLIESFISKIFSEFFYWSLCGFYDKLIE